MTRKEFEKERSDFEDLLEVLNWLQLADSVYGKTIASVHDDIRRITSILDDPLIILE